MALGAVVAVLGLLLSLRGVFAAAVPQDSLPRRAGRVLVPVTRRAWTGAFGAVVAGAPPRRAGRVRRVPLNQPFLVACAAAVPLGLPRRVVPVLVPVPRHAWTVAVGAVVAGSPPRRAGTGPRSCNSPRKDRRLRSCRSRISSSSRGTGPLRCEDALSSLRLRCWRSCTFSSSLRGRPLALCADLSAAGALCTFGLPLPRLGGVLDASPLCALSRFASSS